MFIQNDYLYKQKLEDLTVKFIPENVIISDFWKKYFRHPDGWRIYSGITSDGHPELLISGEKESWLIRRDSLYNGKLGIGGRLDGDISINPRVDSFGFREIPNQYLNKILSMNNEEVGHEEKTNIIAALLEKPPTTLERIKSSSVIRGPMVQSSCALPIISKEQEELDSKLNIEMNKWKRRISYLQ